ncbi:UDP-N-acetylmuramoyl-L-alanyl-D-glutamate--2,6-diaminopimelate ligase [Thiomicrospira sp. ALE5]|uniref:UDP-N-acetylmuramoyl-L-alanyl-D-glutamate--2, 6-diaminopimelate ligase n=1 Tax=Thiomicrospira sp. ALE5 TaxID=748650 RepID=UPI0008F140B7|nr:UDP-N-acetylmuramoyl-L-alanyl-D-glutamate--2,6-diaminopimelate ligase [Thiomicrospira sp. ALE5]SFR60830.1 UDP-N-acetylmuramoylalanyl-D-glutamate--2,6-diaminopimelate ligase [Thiomicrospira sp. ALE5]
MIKVARKTMAELAAFLSPNIAAEQGVWQGNTSVFHLVRHANEASEGSVFIALPGLKTHANQYLQQARQAGAHWVISDRMPKQRPTDMGIWVVPNLSNRLADLANWFYDYPSSQLSLIGVTGTNGKTTTSFLVAQLLNLLGQKVALLGTLGAGVYPNLRYTGHTTPDILTTQAWLAEAVSEGCKFAVMEVSSHAIVQQRIAGLAFAIKALTQVTEDHIDFHGSVAAYHQAKQDFFIKGSQPKNHPAETWVVNIADGVGQQLDFALKQHSAEPSISCVRYQADLSVVTHADASLVALAQSPRAHGFQLSLRWQQQAWSCHTNLLGDYNIENLLCSLSCVLSLGFDLKQVQDTVPSLVAPPGRLERVACLKPLNVVVDFAHTTDALRRVLQTLNELRQAIKPSCSIWVIFGCGGDRDKTKRPAMTAQAYQLADYLVLTSDNPRSEPIETILADMLAGLPSGFDNKKMIIETDRKRAIETALYRAKEGDWVLVAGKGHESTQQINGQCYVFSDQQVIKEWTP